MRSILLLLLGVPIPIILLVGLFSQFLKRAGEVESTHRSSMFASEEHGAFPWVAPSFRSVKGWVPSERRGSPYCSPALFRSEPRYPNLTTHFS